MHLEKIKDIAKEILENLKKQLMIAYHSIAVKVSLFVIILFFISILLIPLTFDNSFLKFSLIQKISNITGGDFDINGDVEIGLFPSPSISINEAVLLNFKHKPSFSKSEQLYNFYAKKIKIRFSLISLLTDRNIKSIEFDEGFFESFGNPNVIPQRNNKITEILIGYKKLPLTSPEELGLNISSNIFQISKIPDQNFSLFIKNIPQLIFKNCSLSIFNKVGINKDFNQINAKLFFSEKTNYGKGSFSSEKVVSNFDFKAVFEDDSIKPKSFFYLSSSSGEIKIKGNYLEQNIGLMSTKFRGDLNIKINELKSFYQTYFANQKSNILSKIRNNNNPIIITGEVNNDLNELSFNDLKIKSGILDGSGDIYFAIDKRTPIIDVNLDLETIDLDAIISPETLKIEGYEFTKNLNILSKNYEQEKIFDFNSYSKLENSDEKNNEVNNEIQLSQNIENKPDQNNKINNLNPKILNNSKQINFIEEIKDLDITADVKIKNLVLLENIFKDCSFYLNFNKTGEVLISPIIIKTPGEGSLYLRGTISDSQTIPKFIGIIDFKGNNLNEILKWLKLDSNKLKFENLGSFRFYSDLFIIPNYSALDGIYLNINNNEIEIFGNSNMIKENKNSIINTNLEISNLDLDRYYRAKNTNLFTFNKESLIKKILWLNNLSTSNQISLTFDNLKYRDENFNNQNLKINLSRGLFNINKLHLLSDKTDINLDLTIDITDKIPILDLKLIGSKLSILSDNDPEKKLDDNQLNHDSVEKNPDLEKNNLINITNLFKGKPASNTIIEKFFGLPSLETFNGGFEIAIDQLEYKNRKILDLLFKGDLKNGTINDAKLSYQDFQGLIAFKGIIDVKSTRILNGNLSMKNVNLGSLFENTIKINTIDGSINLNANILSIANNPKEFFKDIKSEIKFNINQPVIKNLGINNLIVKMMNPVKFSQDLQEPEKIIFDSNSKTVFKQAKGTIFFKNNSDGNLRAEINGSALNAILSGIINPSKNFFDLQFNSVFLTVNSKRTVPISLAIKTKGSPQEFSSIANTNQIRQYLGLENKIYQTKISTQEQNVANDNKSQELIEDNQNQKDLTKNNQIQEPETPSKKIVEINIEKSQLLPNQNLDQNPNQVEPKITENQ